MDQFEESWENKRWIISMLKDRRLEIWSFMLNEKLNEKLVEKLFTRLSKKNYIANGNGCLQLICDQQLITVSS